MYYSTMIRNEMKKIKKADVDYLIYHQVSHLKQALKDKLAISVGVTNVGKLGNEPYYQDIEEFEKDMGILKEVGIDKVSLFSLDGITEEKKLMSFLDAIKRAKPYKPEVCNHVIRNEVLSELLFKVGKFYYNLRR
jgi:radical SAM superfamily enzyme